MDEQLIRARLQGGLYFIADKEKDLNYHESESPRSLPTLSYTTQFVNFESNFYSLEFEFINKEKIGILYKSPYIKVCDKFFDFDPFSKSINSETLDIKHEGLVEIVEDFKKYIDYCEKGLKYITITDREYILELSNKQANVLLEIKINREKHGLSTDRFNSLVLESKSKLIGEIESFLKICYTTFDQDGLKVVYTKNVDFARKLIREIVNDSYNSINY